MAEKKNGGARPGAGRKPVTEEQRLAKIAQKQREMEDELLYPALITAFRNPTQPLTFELSKVQIRLAYGEEALKEWCSWFKCEAGGHLDRKNMVTHPTRWSVNLNKYSLVRRMFRDQGFDIKNLPDVWFPPEAMLARLEVIMNRRTAKRLKKMNIMWDEMERE